MKISRSISCSVLKGRGQQGQWCNFCVCAVADLCVLFWFRPMFWCWLLSWVVWLLYTELCGISLHLEWNLIIHHKNKNKRVNLCTNPHKWYFLYISKYLEKTLQSIFNSVKVNARALIMQDCCTSWSQIMYPTISRFMWTTSYLWPECIWITL